MMNPEVAAPPWTCPFCPLACDHLVVNPGTAQQAPTLRDGSCERASEALRHFVANPALVAQCDGQACELPTAIAAAARVLGASRQPLFAGLGTDVAGARALYPLAHATGAICDANGGDALMHGLRALQDRGQFTTTLAEVRTRADVIVFIGGLPGALAPLTAQRCGIDDAQVAQRRVVLLGAGPDDAQQLAQLAAPGVNIESMALHGDLFGSVALLGALVAKRAVCNAPAGLRSLAQNLLAAKYAVLIGTPARFPAHGALLVERVHSIVNQLNRDTRAAALWIGGGHGAATANQVFTWLSGLPLRSRVGPRGLEHEPLAFGAARLLDGHAVDALLWVSSFDADPASNAPPQTDLPMIVLGPPALAATCRRAGSVFIAVATPGVHDGGHVFRTDGTVLMPLHALREGAEPAAPRRGSGEVATPQWLMSRLPSVASVAQGILHALQQERAL
jgi:formylmethanofuran dehydrogenase subunit B